MLYDVVWSESSVCDMEALFDYLSNHFSRWETAELRERLVKSTNKLAEFPRLYEIAPLYGEGIRRISQSGYHVLYKIDDQTRVVNVVAVVGQRQLARKIH